MLCENLRMLEPIARALTEVKPAHIVYVSSDGLAKTHPVCTLKNSCAEPSSLHGVMHLAREIVLKEVAGDTPLAIVRPSDIRVIDPHNGYASKSISIEALNAKDIQLFGEGEERRDHVYIDDVGKLISLVVRHRSEGVLNIATGEIHSFKEIAEKIVQSSNQNLKVVGNVRNGPMPHNGYRAFDFDGNKLGIPRFQIHKFRPGIAAHV